MIGSLGFKDTLRGLIMGGNALKLNKGSLRTLELLVADENGAAFDLTNSELTFTVKRNLGDPDDAAVIRKTTNNFQAQTLLNNDLAAPTLKILAKDAGVEGNRFRVSTTQTTHRATTSSETLDNGATTLDVVDGTGYVTGAVVEVDDGANTAILVLTADATGNTLTFAAVSGLPAQIASGANVRELTFIIQTYEYDTLIDTESELSMEETNTTNYVVSRLADNAYIRAEDQSVTPVENKRPADVVLQPLTGGVSPAGGIVITDAENGVAQITIETADTSSLSHGYYHYDVKLKYTGFADNILADQVLQIAQVVTQG